MSGRIDTGHYILRGKKVVAVDLMTLAKWLESKERFIKKDMVGDAMVSTVFLGLDHSFGGGPPQLFETMVFPDYPKMNENYCERYATYEEAMAGHQKALLMELKKRLQ